MLWLCLCLVFRFVADCVYVCFEFVVWIVLFGFGLCLFASRFQFGFDCYWMICGCCLRVDCFGVCVG